MGDELVAPSHNQAVTQDPQSILIQPDEPDASHIPQDLVAGQFLAALSEDEAAIQIRKFVRHDLWRKGLLQIGIHILRGIYRCESGFEA